MEQSAEIVLALKAELKKRGKHYRDVATLLGLSEASVKRLFSQEHFSLKRLEQICEYLGIEIFDLLKEVNKQKQKITELTIEQETELVNNEALLVVANSVLNKWTFAEILEIYDFEKTELIRLLVRLDKMGIIELQANNRIKVLFDRKFNWIKNGPIQTLYETFLQKEFLQSRFDKPGEKRMFLSGMLSRQSNQHIQEKMRRLAEEFNQLHKQDEGLENKDRFGTSLLIGIRHWEPSSFSNRRRSKEEREF